MAVISGASAEQTQGFSGGSDTVSELSRGNGNEEGADLIGPLSWDVNLAGLVPSPLLVVPVQVGDQRVNALLDSGASMSLVEAHLVSFDGSWNNASQLPLIKGLGSSAVQPLGVVEAVVHIADLQFQCSCYVVPDGIMERPLILGCNFFKQHRMIIDAKWYRLSGPATSRTWEIYIKQSPMPTLFRDVPVYASDSVQILSTDPVLIPVNAGEFSVPERVDVYYERNVLLGDLRGMTGVLQFAQGSAAVLVERWTPGKPIKIKAGQLVGSVSTLVDVDVHVAAESVKWERAELEEYVDVTFLPEEKRGEVLDVILERSGVLSRTGDDVGCAGVTQHTIELHDYSHSSTASAVS